VWLWLVTAGGAGAFGRPTALARRGGPLAAVLPEGYQQMGNALIVGAAEACGVQPEQLEIAWKAGTIHVAVHASNVFLSDPREEADDDEESVEADDEVNTEVALTDDNDVESTSTPDEPTSTGQGIDMTVLARAINAALDDDGVGLAIAEVHAIEVSTPGATDELSGIMFEAYKGFDVLVKHMDPKKKSVKTIEGRLVERNEEFTVLNLKGRFKKLKNTQVVSVKLPKAKREKGAR
jgi:hypothetical protein